LLGDSTQAYKASRKSAAYLDDIRIGRAIFVNGDGEESVLKVPSGQNCANCRAAFIHANSQTWICSMVRGSIKPNAWCRWWGPPMKAGKGKGDYAPDLHFVQD
jgi:hypothetical protein